MPRTKVVTSKKKIATPETVKVKIHKISTGATLPERAHSEDAAYDLHASEAITIESGRIAKVKTGLRMEIPSGWKGEIYSRSGLASKGIVVSNSPGKIDSDYRGEIKIILHNNRGEDLAGILIGDRIAQFEVNPDYSCDIVFEEANELTTSKRGEFGFGSSGK